MFRPSGKKATLTIRWDVLRCVVSLLRDDSFVLSNKVGSGEADPNSKSNNKSHILEHAYFP